MCGAAERAVEPLVARGQARHAPQKLGERFGHSIAEMPVGGCQHGVDVGKLRIGLSRFGRKFDGRLIALRKLCRPALDQVLNNQQRVARADPDRLVTIRQGGLVIASEAVARAKICG